MLKLIAVVQIAVIRSLYCDGLLYVHSRVQLPS